MKFTLNYLATVDTQSNMVMAESVGCFSLTGSAGLVKIEETLVTKEQRAVLSEQPDKVYLRKIQAQKMCPSLYGK